MASLSDLAGAFYCRLAVGAAFTCLIRWLGWPPKVISMWPISVMFGTLSYVMTPAITFIVLGDFTPRTILAGIALSLFYVWPILLVMGPAFFIYVAQLKKRKKWLKDSMVAYVSAASFIAECAYLIAFFHAD
jgi:hypothetical protein